MLQIGSISRMSKAAVAPSGTPLPSAYTSVSSTPSRAHASNGFRLVQTAPHPKANCADNDFEVNYYHQSFKSASKRLSYMPRSMSKMKTSTPIRQRKNIPSFAATSSPAPRIPPSNEALMLSTPTRNPFDYNKTESDSVCNVPTTTSPSIPPDIPAVIRLVKTAPRPTTGAHGIFHDDDELSLTSKRLSFDPTAEISSKTTTTTMTTVKRPAKQNKQHRSSKSDGCALTGSCLMQSSDSHGKENPGPTMKPGGGKSKGKKALSPMNSPSRRGGWQRHGRSASETALKVPSSQDLKWSKSFTTPKKDKKKSKKKQHPKKKINYPDDGSNKKAKHTSPVRTYSPGYAEAKNFVLSSSEFEPSKFQLDIPSKEDLLMHARICTLMTHYKDVDESFDFATLQGLSRKRLEEIYRQKNGTFSPKVGGGSHRPIVVSLLECAEDLVFEAVFRDRHEELGQVEACIFSSQKHRQFIVTYTGSDELQAKPVKSKLFKPKELAGENNNLHPKHPTPVYPTFRDAYFTNDLEENVFMHLNKLAYANPFCDVVTTGHSFGAALATIGAMRYATLRPMMRVSCHAFGCPRVGGTEFRQYVHSLPNLNIVRVEYGTDPYVFQPEGTDWVHVGHTITINPTCTSSNTTTTSSDNTNLSPPLEVHAYKFDKKHRPASSFLRNGMNKITKLGSHAKNADREVLSYVRAIEMMTHLDLPWVGTFVGEEGKGVSGLDNESRWVV